MCLRGIGEQIDDKAKTIVILPPVNRLNTCVVGNVLQNLIKIVNSQIGTLFTRDLQPSFVGSGFNHLANSHDESIAQPTLAAHICSHDAVILDQF